MPLLEAFFALGVIMVVIVMAITIFSHEKAANHPPQAKHPSHLIDAPNESFKVSKKWDVDNWLSQDHKILVYDKAQDAHILKIPYSEFSKLSEGGNVCLADWKVYNPGAVVCQHEKTP